MSSLGVADTKKKMMVKAMNMMMRHPRIFNAALAAAPHIPRFIYNNGVNPWYGSGREMPHFASKSFRVLWGECKIGKEERG
jgi:L-lactate dehydrogenase complex protein LldF